MATEFGRDRNGHIRFQFSEGEVRQILALGVFQIPELPAGETLQALVAENADDEDLIRSWIERCNIALSVCSD